MVKKVFSSITFIISVLLFLAMGLLTLDMINHNNSLQDIGDLDLFMRVLLYQASYFVISIPGIVSSAVCLKISKSKGIKIVSGVLLTIFFIVFLTFGIILFLGW